MLIFLVYVISFVFLLFHQSSFIFGGDSAEFSLVARTWSISHPPGYPLYSLLVNIANRLIPFGTTPWKIATISSLATVGTSIVIYLLLRKCKIGKPIALFSSLFYIILFPVWEYSEIPEVFALHNLLVITVTYFIFLFLESRKKKYLFMAAFVTGLCISHHHIFVLFVPAWLFLLLRKTGKKNVLSILKRRDLIIASALLFAGFAFYAYAPLASLFSPPLDWENPKTIDGFMRLITRAAYGTFKAYSGSAGNIINQIYDIISLFIFMVMDFRIIGMLLVGLGIFTFRNKKDPFFVFLIIALLSHIFFLFYSNFLLVLPFTLAMYERFLIPLYLILVFFLAFGLQNVQKFLEQVIKKYIRNPSLKKASSLVIPAFMVFYFFIVGIQNYRTIRLIPRMDIFATYAKDLLNTPPKNSIFFVGADNSHFSTAYYHFAEGFRPDLKFVFINLLDKKHYRDFARKLYPDLYIPQTYNGKTGFEEFVSKNKGKGIYLETQSGPSWKPYGLLWKQYDSEAQAISDSGKLVSENNYLWQHVYTIPQLDDNLRKILHLNVVQGQYLYDYLNYSRLLFATDHPEEARNAVALISRYQQSDLRTKFIMVNLYLHDNNCSGAGTIVQEVSIDAALHQPNILPSLQDFYEQCRPEEKETLRLIKERVNREKQSISDL